MKIGGREEANHGRGAGRAGTRASIVEASRPPANARSTARGRRHARPRDRPQNRIDSDCRCALDSQGFHTFRERSMQKTLAFAAAARVRRRRFRRRPGNQGRDRHVRLDRIPAADARQGRRDLQEERPRRVAQDDPAEGPPPGDRVGRRPVRRHDRRDVDRLERERCRHEADLPDGQELRRRRHGGARQRREDRRPQGQDRRRLRARDRALLHAGLVPEEERAVGEGRHRRQPRARRGRAGVRRRPERRRDDLRALPVDRARQSERRQDHRDHARLPDDHGHVRLHAEVPRRQPEGRAGARRTATSRRSR